MAHQRSRAAFAPACPPRLALKLAAFSGVLPDGIGVLCSPWYRPSRPRTVHRPDVPTARRMVRLVDGVPVPVRRGCWNRGPSPRVRPVPPPHPMWAAADQGRRRRRPRRRVGARGSPHRDRRGGTGHPPPDFLPDGTPEGESDAYLLMPCPTATIEVGVRLCHPRAGALHREGRGPEGAGDRGSRRAVLPAGRKPFDDPADQRFRRSGMLICGSGAAGESSLLPQHSLKPCERAGGGPTGERAAPPRR